jgi:hypothetical protein
MLSRSSLWLLSFSLKPMPKPFIERTSSSTVGVLPAAAPVKR